MTETSDPIASWFFNFKTEQERNPFELLKNIIQILESYGLLLLEKTEFIRGIFGDSHYISSNRGMQLDWIFNELKKEHSHFLFFTGTTIISINKLDHIKVKNIIQCSFDFDTKCFALKTYSDLWLPLDRNDNKQLDLAIQSSLLLEKALKDIKELGFDDIIPDVGIIHADELYPQKGFRVYIPRYLMNPNRNKYTDIEWVQAENFIIDGEDYLEI